MSRTRASALFPASGVRPNSSVPEEFQTLTRFRSVAVARTRPVAGASAGLWFGLACPCLTAFACAHHVVCHSNR